MGIDDLRKKNCISEPPISHEGSRVGHLPSSQSVAHTGIGVSTPGDESLKKNRIEIKESQTSSGTELRIGGAVPGSFGQGQNTAYEEAATGAATGSNASSRVTTEHTQNNGTEREARGTGPGVFGQDIERGTRTENVYEQGRNRGEDDSIRSISDRITLFFQNLPELWQVDAICIFLTVTGLILIILNLPAVLAFIFGILYAIASLIFTVVFYIALIVGAIALLFRRGRRR